MRGQRAQMRFVHGREVFVAAEQAAGFARHVARHEHAGLTPELVEARNRRKRVAAYARDEAACSTTRAGETWSAGPGNRRRFLAIRQEDEVRAGFGSGRHGGKQAVRDMAFGIPAHPPVDGADLLVERREILAGLDGLEQHERTALDEDGKAQAGAAGEIREQALYGALFEGDAAGRFTVKRGVADVHAAGDVEHTDDVVDGAA